MADSKAAGVGGADSEGVVVKEEVVAGVVVAGVVGGGWRGGGEGRAKLKR